MRFELDPSIQAHYAREVERDRLTTWGRLEFERTKDLMERFLPPSPARVLDVGGAEGAYALFLAARGYEVHLLDPWAPHVEAARTASASRARGRLASVAVGDARDLPFADASADAVLMLGPLYHLIDPADRRRALDEARRVLQPGGVLMAAAISRFASTYDGIRTGAIAETAFEAVVEDDLAYGVHRNPDPEGRPEWFTLAYFHTPDGLGTELRAAGFEEPEVLAIEGPGAFWDAGPALDHAATREAVMRAIRRVEAEPALLGASAHLMAIATAR
ncbi:MAG: class I SAM-dependent methyltransferase [Solirubrobacteraceae bacterium]